jgi:exonuclease VII small subunit
MPTAEPNPTVDAPPLRLGAVLTRLDQIRGELDRDDLDLEDQLVLYREGVTHVAAARRILEASRAEVELLAEEGEGADG